MDGSLSQPAHSHKSFDKYTLEIATTPSRPKETGNVTFEQKKKIFLWNEGSVALSQINLVASLMRGLNLIKAPVQETMSGILRDLSNYLLVKEA